MDLGFFAYPASPTVIGATIESAIQSLKQQGMNGVESWRALDIPGYFIASQVLQKIDEADYLLADISNINFNVVFEIGYAIGQNKRVLIFKNKSIAEKGVTVKELGIFDTIGYQEYQNSSELKSCMLEIGNKSPIPLYKSQNIRQPLYVIEAKHRTDWQIRLTSRIKKTGYNFRTFDPNESPRLPAPIAIDAVSQSYGVVIPFVSSNTEGHEVHNMRCAFVAGLAKGMGRVTLMLQPSEEDPIPLDYRDMVRICIHPNDINEAIADFASEVNSAIQSTNINSKTVEETLLQKINLGASSAENEIRGLDEYYLKTDAYMQTKRGEAHLVVGRKGSGKSAIFITLRDEEENKKGVIVLDLQPDGYKLIKFKESILRFLEEGTMQHTIMAFWEYILLLEICHKILQQDKDLHTRNHNLYEPYRKLAETYKSGHLASEGDFSERMSTLIDRITNDYTAQFSNEENVRMSNPEVTNLVYTHDIRELTEDLHNYLKHKEALWLLFDNIDKGWPTSGLQKEDLVIVRALVDATRKIERQMVRLGISAKTVIFLRNDVYELLVRETSDRGKEAAVGLDWTDPDLLREIIRLRLLATDSNQKDTFQEIWGKICVSHIRGEESSQYLIDRSLMRPRFLINLIDQCKGFAINLGHRAITESDLEKGLEAFSTDLVTDIGYEIRDVNNKTEDLLYNFIGANPHLSSLELNKLLTPYSDIGLHSEEIIDLLLWYGFLGVRHSDEKISYIYNVHYNMKLLKALVSKGGDSTVFSINPAFWKGLLIEV
ncbi:P-loop ATPase, Sll1717 family [Vogesella amnigena]|uniref:P-loop ATPase, Sll1717 family n=1 Tax=Vogesella amnigena TaxID=1507449 RepID=A0ABV7TQF9_9NEIS